VQPAGPFVLALQALEEGESRCEIVGTAADLDLRPEEVVLATPVVFRAKIFRSREKVEIQGRLRTEITLTCDRCLDPIGRSLEAPVRVYGERRESRDHRPEKEVREDDLGIVYHDGRFVDLTDELRQLILVEVPWHVVCREDCLGLCPRCGANRNQQPCACMGGADSQRP
jgi:uncharacterized protein